MLQIKYGPEIEDTRRFLEILSEHKKVTFITTSSRSPYVEKFGESPKSSQLARKLSENLERRGVKVNIIDATKLEIKNCLGCVSEVHGNNCGAKESAVKDKEKNPNGKLRCWASHDFEDDELWKISKSIYESQAVIFFGSQRWGSVNAMYQKVIERLVIIGQNWKVEESITTQKKVLEFFGFQTPDPLFIGWQYTRDSNDETQESYKNAVDTFEQAWNMQIFKWEKPEGTELSIEKSNESNFVTFKDFLNEVKNI